MRRFILMYLLLVVGAMIAGLAGKYAADYAVERGWLNRTGAAALITVVLVVMAYHKLDKSYVTKLALISAAGLLSMCIIEPMGELQFDGVQSYLLLVLVVMQGGLYAYAIGLLAGAISAAAIVNKQRLAA